LAEERAQQPFEASPSVLHREKVCLLLLYYYQAFFFITLKPCGNGIYYTNALLLLVWSIRVAILVAEKQLMNTFTEMRVGMRMRVFEASPSVLHREKVSLLLLLLYSRSRYRS